MHPLHFRLAEVCLSAFAAAAIR